MPDIKLSSAQKAQLLAEQKRVSYLFAHGTPEEVAQYLAEATASVRKGWTAAEERKRRNGGRVGPLETRIISMIPTGRRSSKIED